MAYKINPFTGNFDQVLDKASEIKYSNTTSGLTSTTTQGAIDELGGLVSPMTIVTVTSNYYLPAVNTIVLVNYAGPVSIILPTPVANKRIIVKDISRPGVHAKTKTSKIKTSKLYKKAHKGQGK